MTDEGRAITDTELRIIQDAEWIAARFRTACVAAPGDRPGEDETDLATMRDLAGTVRAIVWRNAERRQLVERGEDARYERPYL